MPKFKTKPCEIEAVQFVGNNALEIYHFTDGKTCPTKESLGHSDWDRKQLLVPTLEGYMIASHGDWIVRGLKGEFYPVKPEIFALKYERVA